VSAQFTNAISGAIAFGSIILSLFFIYAKMNFHFYYLKKSKGYFQNYSRILDYWLDPIEKFSKPMELVELATPLFFRSMALEKGDEYLRTLGRKALIMLAAFYISFVTFLVVTNL
jgi:hypothetical protein